MDDELDTNSVIDSVCLSPDGKIVVVVYENQIDFFDVSKYMDETSHRLINTITEVVVLVVKKNYEIRSNDMALYHTTRISPDNNFLAVTNSIDQTIKIYDINKIALVNILTGRFGNIRSVNFSDNCTRIIFEDDYDAIIIWNFYNNSINKINTKLWSYVFAHEVYYCEEFIIIVDNKGKIIKYDALNNVTRLSRNFGKDCSNFWSSCFLRNKQKLAIGNFNADNYIEIWDLANGKLVMILSDKNFNGKLKCISSSQIKMMDNAH